MLLKYVDATGREVVVPDEATLANAIRNRQITESTRVLRFGEDQWVAAGSLPVFHGVASAAMVEPVPAPTRGLWLILIGVAMGVLGIGVALTTAMLTSGGSPRAIGYAFGSVAFAVFWDVILGLILSIPVFWLITRAGRSATPAVIAVVVGAVILVDLALRSSVAIYNTSYAARTLQDVKAATDQLKQGTSPSASSNSDDTEFKRWLDSYIRRNLEVQADLQAAIVQYRVAAMLSPEVFRNAESIAATRKNAASFRDELQVAQQRLERLLDEAPNEVAALDMPTDIKNGMLRVIRDTVPQTKERLRAYYTMEKEFMRQIDDLLYFVEQRYPSGYQMQGQQIAFVNQPDLDEFNRKMAAIVDTAKKEEEMRQAMTLHFQLQTEQLSKVVGK